MLCKGFQGRTIGLALPYLCGIVYFKVVVLVKLGRPIKSFSDLVYNVLSSYSTGKVGIYIALSTNLPSLVEH